MQIEILQKKDTQKLEDFLAMVYGDEYRPLAKIYLKKMFSGEVREPAFVVAKKEDQLIGAASFSEELFTVDVWGIGWVAVHPDCRNNGVGAEIINACLKQISISAQKDVTVILRTYAGKTELYDNLGFKKAGQDHEGGWVMLKHLPMY